MQEKVLLGLEELKSEVAIIKQHISINYPIRNAFPVCPIKLPIKDIKMYEQAIEVLKETHHEENFVSFEYSF